MGELRRAAKRIVEVLRIARANKLDFMASGITYYELFSLVPLTLLAFLGLAALGGESFAASLLTWLTGILPEAGQDIVRDVMASSAGQTSLIGLVILFWASLQLFRSFDIAFTEIYQEEYDETLIEEIESAFLALVILAISVALIVSAGSVIAAFPQSPSLGLVWAVLTFLALTAVFLPLYYVFTDVDITIPGLLPGALVAAAGWTLLQSGFSLYTGAFGGSIYGVFGGILLLVLWMYFGNMLILLGAVVNYVNWQKGLKARGGI